MNIIDDLKKENKTPDELLRCKLAATYRLVDLKGWSWNIYNHITVKSKFKKNLRTTSEFIYDKG